VGSKGVVASSRPPAAMLCSQHRGGRSLGAAQGRRSRLPRLVEAAMPNVEAQLGGRRSRPPQGPASRMLEARQRYPSRKPTLKGATTIADLFREALLITGR